MKQAAGGDQQQAAGAATAGGWQQHAAAGEGQRHAAAGEGQRHAAAGGAAAEGGLQQQQQQPRPSGCRLVTGSTLPALRELDRATAFLYTPRTLSVLALGLALIIVYAQVGCQPGSN